MIKSDVLEKARCEIKFVTNVNMYNHLKTWIYTQEMMFKKAYPPRIVNNIYYDTIDLDSYWENLSGKSSRTKFRLRWYGESIALKDFVLELKIKRNRLGWKSSQAVKFSENLSDISLSEIRNDIIDQLHDGLKQRFLMSNIPVLINSYARDYFVSYNNKIRITLDKDISFYDQRFLKHANKKYKNIAPDIVIMEFKFAAEDLYLAENVMQTLAVSPSKVSKYVLGINSILGV
ncbi:polyphosphate polymerase domain-containing protein [bacterium]